MKHQRQAIREAVVAMLTGKTAAQDRVFKTREVPWKRTELPGIAVYSLEESQPDSDVMAPDQTVRVLQLAILGVETLTGNVDDALDALSLQIESVWNTNPSLGGLAFASRLTTTRIGIDEESGRPVGAVRLTYEVRYST